MFQYGVRVCGIAIEGSTDCCGIYPWKLLWLLAGCFLICKLSMPLPVPPTLATLLSVDNDDDWIEEAEGDVEGKDVWWDEGVLIKLLL